MAKVAKQSKATVRQHAAPGGEQPKHPRWQIESPTRGIYVGSRYAERTTNWPTFTHSPWSEAAIIRFDDKVAAEAELVWVQSKAANTRVREVE